MAIDDPPLEERRRALEEEYFARRNREALAALRSAQADRIDVAPLAAALGIADEAVLRRVAALPVGPQASPALWLVPLVFAAWSAGRPSRRARTVVLEDSAALGDEAGAVVATVRGWLAAPPPSALLDCWAELVSARIAGLPPEVRSWLREWLQARIAPLVAPAPEGEGPVARLVGYLGRYGIAPRSRARVSDPRALILRVFD